MIEFYLFMFILSKIQPPKAATAYSGLEFSVHLGRGQGAYLSPIF